MLLEQCPVTLCAISAIASDNIGGSGNSFGALAHTSTKPPTPLRPTAKIKYDMSGGQNRQPLSTAITADDYD